MFDPGQTYESTSLIHVWTILKVDGGFVRVLILATESDRYHRELHIYSVSHVKNSLERGYVRRVA